MKILITLLLAGLLINASADSKSGQKYYLKILKSKFNMNGTKFAVEHTVEEWNELFSNNAEGFIKEYSERFPTAETVLKNLENKDKLQEVGEFAKEYGSDSGNIPSCG